MNFGNTELIGLTVTDLFQDNIFKIVVVLEYFCAKSGSNTFDHIDRPKIIHQAFVTISYKPATNVVRSSNYLRTSILFVPSWLFASLIPAYPFADKISQSTDVNQFVTQCQIRNSRMMWETSVYCLKVSINFGFFEIKNTFLYPSVFNRYKSRKKVR